MQLREPAFGPAGLGRVVSLRVGADNGRLQVLSDLWWRRLPAAADRWSAALGVVLRGGQYVAAWPSLGAFATPAALLLGLAAGGLHLSGGATFTTSLPLLALLVLLSHFGAGLGAAVWFGYVVSDLLVGPHGTMFAVLHPGADPFMAFLHVHVPLLLSYVLLSLLLVFVPVMSVGLRILALGRAGHLRAQLGREAVLQALLQGGLVFLWTQGMPALMRPVFTWQGAAPVAESVLPLQQYGWVLAVVSAMVGATRVLMEFVASDSPIVAAALLDETPFDKVKARKQRLSATSIFIKTLFTTWIFSGLLATWSDAALFASALLVIACIRNILLARWNGWIDAVAPVPLFLRIIGGVTVGYFLGIQMVQLVWDNQPGFQERLDFMCKLPTFAWPDCANTGTFRPLLIGAVTSLLLLSILIPGRVRPRIWHGAADGGSR